MKKLISTKDQQGSILPITVIFSIIGISLVMSMFAWTIQRHYLLNRRIAQTKAMFNAESGLAEKAFKVLVQADFTSVDTLLVPGGIRLDNKPLELSMGLYRNVHLKQELDDNFQVMPTGTAEGVSFVKNSNGNIIEVSDSARISFVEKSLAKYMYLTDDEKAGGAPFVFTGSTRRDVTFGANDNLSGGAIQSNSQVVMSDFGCPEFNGTFHLTIDMETGEVIEPDWGSNCSPQQVFQGDPPTLQSPPVKLPPEGYGLAKNAANYVFDATELLKWNGYTRRDTLIMTDIQFLADGRFRVKRYWFLKPPHLNATAAVGDGETPYPLPLQLEGVVNPNLDCGNPSDLRTCGPYADSLYAYHAKLVNAAGNDVFVDPTISGPHGYAHYDYPANDQTLIGDITYIAGGPKVIYVKGGPVRVHGIYNGRYTVVTDEFQTYRRHAWNVNMNAPIDTLWCNIWITDDLRNADAPFGNMIPPQPEEQCEGGSDNRMGLVSGANIIVANTPENGAANRSFGQDVVIHASMVAFNESFTVHYWQNTTSDFWDIPHGDNRGPMKYGTFTGGSDIRGTIRIWGGLVQKYRGYVKRNNPGPYDLFPGIGYDKDYNYDENNACSPPPYFPTIQFENNEKSLEMRGYGPVIN